MTPPFTPERWAFEITHLLNAVLGADRYPLDIAMIAREYSAQRFPGDPILKVAGGGIPNFDGALYPSRKKAGWHILYNNTIASRGRINFTLAHEVGGGYNGFPEDEFAEFLQTIEWQNPENVVLVMQPEEGDTRIWAAGARQFHTWR